ncbi:hypothetical protein QL285_008258 [Trifolium repens]|nr:hypothetical protein QL285_008258 [Trifolium repens]
MDLRRTRTKRDSSCNAMDWKWHCSLSLGGAEYGRVSVVLIKDCNEGSYWDDHLKLISDICPGELGRDLIKSLGCQEDAATVEWWRRHGCQLDLITMIG